MAAQPLVAIIMGSQSDWETMRHAAETLRALGVPHESQIVSAHRTPDRLFKFAAGAEARGLRAIIAGAGGAAHLPGMCASKTAVPVLGVPVESRALKGLDSLLSIAQMPAGIPVGTLAIGVPGAINAALLAAAIVAHDHPDVRRALHAFRNRQTRGVGTRPVSEPTRATSTKKRATSPLTRARSTLRNATVTRSRATANPTRARAGGR